MQEDRILYEDDCLLVTASIPTESRTLVIGFSGRRHFVGRVRDEKIGWSEDFFNKYHISFVSIVCKSDRWYQSLLDHSVSQVIVSKIKNRFKSVDRVVTYGTSMGGYAAIKFSSLFNANHVFSLSPPSRIMDHPVWGKDCEHEISPISVSDVSGVSSVYLAFDPLLCDPSLDRTLDALYAKEIHEKISSFCTVNLLPFKHFAHPTSVVLADIGLLKLMILELVNNGRISSTYPSQKYLSKSRKYVKFKIRNLVAQNKLISASRLIYHSRMLWFSDGFDGSAQVNKVAKVLKDSGLYPDLLFLLQLQDLIKKREDV